MNVGSSEVCHDLGKVSVVAIVSSYLWPKVGKGLVEEKVGECYLEEAHQHADRLTDTMLNCVPHIVAFLEVRNIFDLFHSALMFSDFSFQCPP